MATLNSEVIEIDNLNDSKDTVILKIDPTAPEVKSVTIFHSYFTSARGYKKTKEIRYTAAEFKKIIEVFKRLEEVF